jgi:hypothetical protein
MTGNTEHIINKIFQAKSLEDVSVRLLEELTEQNPYFGIGHFLLSQKLQKENSPAFKDQVQKTGLYFPNPFWLQWLLRKTAEESGNPLPQQIHLESAKENGIDQPLAVKEEEKNEAREVNEEQAKREEDKIAGTISKTVISQSDEASTEIREETLPFEPYHTIDYFASQGIKFAQDLNPADKLGKQLKSFTEWLKMMKKLPQKTTELILDEKARDIIEADAAQSLLTKEVLTETMAEVLIKQGKMEDAAEVYRKLSLHNPGKSLYFAAKIEQLKVK